MYDLVAMGEMLIDFTSVRPNEKGCRLYEPHPGGAPANVACAISKLGRKAAFIGKVGDDQFGVLCRDALLDVGVDAGGLVFSKEHPTTLSFVHIDGEGDRSFSFYRSDTADTSISPDDIRPAILENTKFFHFGSLSMSAGTSRRATLYCLDKAIQAGASISFDPNLRPALWSSLAHAKAAMEQVLPMVDVLKLSDEEASFLLGDIPPQRVTSILSERYDIPIVLLTRGRNGCTASIDGKLYDIGAYDVNTVDTTGSGDGFMAGALYCLLEWDVPLDKVTEAQADKLLRFANATGSLMTTKHGAIPSIPTVAEINNCVYQGVMLQNV